MRPQRQRFGHREGDGVFGDCHRTCVAMVLNMDRDDVPHFMDGLPANLPPDDPRCRAAEQAEVDWLAGHGLVPVNIPFDGAMSLELMLEQLRLTGHGAPVVLGCNSGGINHSVVTCDGEIYNPNFGSVDGPMQDGFWWVTVYSVGPNWMTRAATRAVAVLGALETAAEVAEGNACDCNCAGAIRALAMKASAR